VEQPWFDEATGRVDVEAFERFMEKGRLEGLGFVPGPLVSAHALRVERQKRRPTRTLVQFVLDCDRDGPSAVGDLTSVDDYPFEARSETRAPVVYRSTNPAHRMLHGAVDFRFDDVDGTRAISPAEIQALIHAPRATPCWAPFALEAHHDDAPPGIAAYSLLVERVGRTFSQELYYFLARGHDDALAVSFTVGQDDPAVDGEAEVRRLLYFTGFTGPWHGQVLFEHAVIDASEPAR